MKKLLVITFFAFLAFGAWEKFGPGASIEPLSSEPYVAVYGRTTCGYTKRTLRTLEDSSVNFKFYSVDNRESADLLHARMEKSGISTGRYNLPVVDVNGDISVRPDVADVLSAYNKDL